MRPNQRSVLHFTVAKKKRQQQTFNRSERDFLFQSLSWDYVIEKNKYIEIYLYLTDINAPLFNWKNYLLFLDIYAHL